MSDIDDKYETIMDAQKQLIREKAYQAVDAYLDAGGPDDFVIMSRNDWKRNAAIAGFMTGQEWYDGFAQRMFFMVAMTWCDRKGKEYHEILDREHILMLARQAAGIEGEK